MFGIAPLTPAYGRDYRSKSAAQDDFDADLDFQTPSGRVTNRSDLLAMDDITFGLGDKIEVRSADLTKLFVVTI